MNLSPAAEGLFCFTLRGFCAIIKTRCAMIACGSIFMKKFIIFLKAESEGAKEEISCTAEGTEENGTRFFRFPGEGCDFCLRFGSTVALERAGEISYAIRLDPSAETSAEIRTPYGVISAAVQTGDLRMHARGGSFFFLADYVLSFSDFSQKHRILFTAKEASASDGAGNDISEERI